MFSPSSWRRRARPTSIETSGSEIIGTQASWTRASSRRAHAAASEDCSQAERLRAPRPEDGPAVSRLIRDCPPLDRNSAYCHLVQCTHFADTCVLAEREGRLVGWLSAHRPPSAPEQIFVWQVAVHPTARGAGLARRMIEALLARPSAWNATVLTASITEDNSASWRLFTAFAEDRGLELRRTKLFDREAHFAGAHATEWQVAIGPLPPWP